MTDIIALIDAEIARLESARALIAGASKTTTKEGSGRSKRSAKKKRTLSPEGRARIAAAAKARWAKQRKTRAK